MRRSGSLAKLRHADPEYDLDDIYRWIGPRSDLRATSINGEANLTLETTRAIIDNPDGHTLVASLQDGRKYGLVWLASYGPPSSRTYEIECIIGDSEFRGTAVAGAMIYEAMRFAFMNLDALKILVTVPEHNVRATSLLARHRVGVLECVLRDFYFIEGEYLNGWVWGILKSEYLEVCNKWTK